MNELPTVSVVIPCYNAARYVLATIKSVLSQNVAPLEVIVVDDGSSDGSAELIRAHYPHVRVEIQQNAGVAVARNRGIAMAQGEYLAFVDADDIWLPTKLGTQLELLQAHPDCRMVYTAWHIWNSDAAQPTPAEISAFEASGMDSEQWNGPSGWIYANLLLDCAVWTSTVVAARTLFDEIGYFDSSLRLGEDYDLWLRASRVTPILRVARPLALYRQHSANITRSTPTDNYRARVIESALAKWGLASPDGSKAERRTVDRMLAKTWSDFAAAQLQSGAAKPARQSSRNAIRLSGAHLPGWKVFFKSYLPTPAAASERKA